MLCPCLSSAVVSFVLIVCIYNTLLFFFNNCFSFVQIVLQYF